MSLLRKLRGYRAQTARAQTLAPGAARWPDLARDFWTWSHQPAQPKSPLELRKPWLNFAATRFLERQLRPTMRALEWGSGGSTLFFAQRVAEVVSVENDVAWVDLVRQALEADGLKNVAQHAIPPDEPPGTNHGDPADPGCYQTTARMMPGATFEKYVTFIDAFPDGHFNVILVDGRARPACLAHATPKLAPGGWLILDNAERPHYQRAAAYFGEHGWREVDFFGPGPGVWQFWRTRLWRKPA